MSENMQSQSAETDAVNEAGNEPRKISLAEAMKQKMAQKKQAQADANENKKHQAAGNQPVMKSQHTKKVNNQRKKMGV